MSEVTFQIKKESNRATKDALIDAGCILESASKKRYVITTTDMNLVPNDARIQVSRKHWAPRISNFADMSQPQAAHDYNPKTGNFDGEILGHHISDVTFISGKQFKFFEQGS